MIAFLWAVLLIVVLWAALALLPAKADGRNPLPYAIALIDFLWIPVILVAVGGLLLHNAALFCAALAVCFLVNLPRTPYWRFFADRKPAPKAASSHGVFHVMTLNCRYGRADAAAIVKAVQDRDIAVLALQEVSEKLVTDLNIAGLDDALPYHQLGKAQASDNGGFNGVWIRVEPSDASPVTVTIPAADVPGVCFPISATRTITFASAHPKSPMRGCRDWSDGIIGLGELASTQQAHDITVVMGDLNSNITHPSFRALLRSGFQDAAMMQGYGRQATFPSWLPWPRIILDHILFTRGLHASHVQSFAVKGSDHLALAATLSLE